MRGRLSIWRRRPQFLGEAMAKLRGRGLSERLSAAAKARRAELERYNARRAEKSDKPNKAETLPSTTKKQSVARENDPSATPNAVGRPISDLILPPALVESVRSQRAILFLGAGASREASNTNGQCPPLGGDLKKLISAKFFGQELNDHDLMSVAEMAISAHGSSVVYEFIRDCLEDFFPSEGHLLIPTFRWKLLATTNYDLLIERAYSSVRDHVQKLVKFVRDSEPVEERLQKVHDPVILLKLHG